MRTLNGSFPFILFNKNIWVYMYSKILLWSPTEQESKCLERERERRSEQAFLQFPEKVSFSHLPFKIPEQEKYINPP